MRIYLLFILLLLTQYATAQCDPKALKQQMKEAAKQMEGEGFLQYLYDLEEENESRRDYCKLAVIYERLGTYYYTRDADKSISYRYKSAENYLLAHDKARATMSRQNIAFIYDEQRKDYPAAIRITEDAIKSWQELNDTTQLANMQKYYGYLLGKTGKYDEAAKQVGYAITNFSKQGNRNGVAVSYYDMAGIMFEQKKYIPAIGALQFAKQHWLADSNAKRLVGINNFMLRVYLAAGDLQNATEAYNANLQYVDSANIHWVDKLSFFRYGAELLRKTSQPTEAAELDASYKALKDSLTAKGIKPE